MDSPLDEKKIDLLVRPANDQQETSSFHTKMAFFRGIENGINVIGEAIQGLADVAIASGTIPAAKDYFQKGNLIMEEALPIQGKWAVIAYCWEYICVGMLFRCLFLLL